MAPEFEDQLEADSKILRIASKASKSKVKVIFIANVPEGLNFVYIAGSFNNWDPNRNRLEWIQRNKACTITIDFAEGEVIEYKYTQGTWDAVETTKNQGFRPNRRIEVKPDRQGLMQITDVVEEWKDNKAIIDLINNLKSRRDVEALGKTGSPLAVDPILQIMFDYPYYKSRDFFQTALYALAPYSSLNPVIVELVCMAAEYDIVKVENTCQPNVSVVYLWGSGSAVETLCDIKTDETSNMLHLITKKKNITTTCSNFCGASWEVLIDCSNQRNMARVELNRRGNPPYNPDVYLPKSSYY